MPYAPAPVIEKLSAKGKYQPNMYKRSLKQSLFVTFRLALAIGLIFLAMVVLKLTTGGTNSVREYLGSIGVLNLVVSTAIFFLVVMSFTTLATYLGSKHSSKKEKE